MSELNISFSTVGLGKRAILGQTTKTLGSKQPSIQPHALHVAGRYSVKRAKDFNIVLDDVAPLVLSYGVEFSRAVEQKQGAHQHGKSVWLESVCCFRCIRNPYCNPQRFSGNDFHSVGDFLHVVTPHIPLVVPDIHLHGRGLQLFTLPIARIVPPAHLRPFVG